MSRPDRHERIALNESTFREINDRVEADHAKLREPPERMRFVCECGKLDCREQIEMTATEYEHVRSESPLFAVAPGHEIEDAEAVVERNERFHLVRKNSDVHDIVEDTDPRRRR